MSSSGRNGRSLRRAAVQGSLAASEAQAPARTGSAPPLTVQSRTRLTALRAEESSKSRSARAATTSPTGLRKPAGKATESVTSSSNSTQCSKQRASLPDQMTTLEERYARLARGVIAAEHCYTSANLVSIENETSQAFQEALAEAASRRDARIEQAAQKHALTCAQVETMWQSRKQAAHVAFVSRRGDARMRTRQAISAQILTLGREYEELLRSEAPGMQLAPELLEQIRCAPVGRRPGPRGASRTQQDEDYLLLGLKPVDNEIQRSASPPPVMVTRPARRKRRADSTLLPYTRPVGTAMQEAQNGPLPPLAHLIQRESAAAEHVLPTQENVAATAAPPAPTLKPHHTYFMPASRASSRHATPYQSRQGSPSGYSYPYASAANSQSRKTSPTLSFLPAPTTPHRRPARDLWAKANVPASGTATPEPGADEIRMPTSGRKVSLPWQIPVPAAPSQNEAATSNDLKETS